jgi:ferric-dicitrate binding protein FerR (iron transport regulator)
VRTVRRRLAWWRRQADPLVEQPQRLITAPGQRAHSELADRARLANRFL